MQYLIYKYQARILLCHFGIAIFEINEKKANNSIGQGILRLGAIFMQVKEVISLI